MKIKLEKITTIGSPLDETKFGVSIKSDWCLWWEEKDWFPFGEGYIHNEEQANKEAKKYFDKLVMAKGKDKTVELIKIKEL